MLKDNEISKLKEQEIQEDHLEVLGSLVNAITNLNGNDDIVKAIQSLESVIKTKSLQKNDNGKDIAIILQKIQDKASSQHDSQAKSFNTLISQVLKEIQRHNKELENKIGDSTKAIEALKGQMEHDMNAEWDFETFRNKGTNLIDKIKAKRIK